MPHLETTSLGVWVGVGARHETEAEHGISHFLEHMAFKGTRSRSAQKIAEEIEEVGGDLNAATGLENTAYFARVLKGDDGVALTLLADILQNSSFAEDDFEREQEVIRQEIAATRDSPDERVFDLVHDAAWPGQAIGRTDSWHGGERNAPQAHGFAGLSGHPLSPGKYGRFRRRRCPPRRLLPPR